MTLGESPNSSTQCSDEGAGGGGGRHEFEACVFACLLPHTTMEAEGQGWGQGL
jgi:hypothetical protein